MIKCTFLSCGWLASSFDQCLLERTMSVNTTWIFMNCFFFWVLLAFLDQPFWLLQLSISNVPYITTFILAFQAPRLVYLQKAVSPYTREKWPLSKNHSWHSLEITWLIDTSDGLNLMSNLDSFFKSFSFYLFKSFSFYQIISNCH